MSMRQDKADRLKEMRGGLNLGLASSGLSGKRVAEAKGLSKAFGDKVLLKGFSTRILRGDRVAVVEMAAASGLGLVDPSERDPVAATTFGTGELIVAAVAAGADVVYLGVGGSATTDGGAGAIDTSRAVFARPDRDALPLPLCRFLGDLGDHVGDLEARSESEPYPAISLRVP